MTKEELAAEWAKGEGDPIEHKAYLGFEVKKLDRKTRSFEGLAATWDLDLGRDVIHRGAFKDTLAEWKRSPAAMKLIDCHNYFSIRAVVGKMTDAQETKEGLWTKWAVIPGEDGDAVLDRLQAGVIESLSIGYEPIDFDFSQVGKGDEAKVIRNLRRIGLKEVSLVVFPMNPNALIDLTPVKALAARGGLGPEARRVIETMRGELASILETKTEGNGEGPKPGGGELPDPPEPPQVPPEQKEDLQDPPAEESGDSFHRVARLKAARLRLLASQRGIYDDRY